MIAIAQRTLRDTESALRQEFMGCDEVEALQTALAAEHLRVRLYGEVVRDSPLALHTTQLVTSARRAINLVWPATKNVLATHELAEAPDLISDTLDRMALIGDAFNTGGGQWIATPLRFIVSNTNTRLLVIGTAPLPVVQKKNRKRVLTAGVARLADADQSNPAIEQVLHSVDEWIGDVLVLPDWTKQVLASHETQMQSIEGLTTEQLEIYAPDIARRQRRTGLWVPASEVTSPMEGVRLCQPMGRYAKSYDRPHYLAHFDMKGGSLALRRCAAIDRSLTLRLRFGLDQALGTYRQFSMVRTGNVLRMDRLLTLPFPENRIYGIGWRNGVNPDGSNRTAFHAECLPFVEAVLRRLSLNPTISVRGDA